MPCRSKSILGPCVSDTVVYPPTGSWLITWKQAPQSRHSCTELGVNWSGTCRCPWVCVHAMQGHHVVGHKVEGSPCAWGCKVTGNLRVWLVIAHVLKPTEFIGKWTLSVSLSVLISIKPFTLLINVASRKVIYNY